MYGSFCVGRRRRLLDAETALRDYGTRGPIDKIGSKFHHYPALIGSVEYLREFSQFQSQQIIRSSAICGAYYCPMTEAGDAISDPLGQQARRRACPAVAGVCVRLREVVISQTVLDCGTVKPSWRSGFRHQQAPSQP